jgi:hypothetical protein
MARGRSANVNGLKLYYEILGTGKPVVVSAPHKSDAWYPEVRAGMKSMNAEAAKAMVGSPMQQAYARVAPRPEAWTTLVVKSSELLRQDYDWSPAVAALKAPTLIVIGDADSMTHYDIFASPLPAGTVTSFLDAPMPASL